VGHPRLASGIRREAARLVDLSVSGSLRPEFPDELAVPVEDLDPVVLRVGDVEIAAGVRREPARLGELAGTRSGDSRFARGGDGRGLGGVVARGRVLNAQLQGREWPGPFLEILSDEEHRVLGSDRAPDL